MLGRPEEEEAKLKADYGEKKKKPQGFVEFFFFFLEATRKKKTFSKNAFWSQLVHSLQISLSVHIKNILAIFLD